MKCVLNLILSIGMPYYQGGCNIDYLTRSKVLEDNPWEDPKRKPLLTNLEILEWSSVDLMDQVRSFNKGFGILWSWPVWPVRGPVWQVCTDRAMASFLERGMYTLYPHPFGCADAITILSHLWAVWALEKSSPTSLCEIWVNQARSLSWV